jgi:hypothetical protein
MLHTQLVELGAGGFRAAGPVEVDVLPLDPGAHEGVDLGVGVLVGGRDAAVSVRRHAVKDLRSPGNTVYLPLFSRQPIKTHAS